MMQNRMRHLAPTAAMFAVLLALASRPASAAVLYSQNFESPVPLGSASFGPGGFVQANNVGGTSWQIQGGGGAGGVSLVAGIDANGAGGGQSLAATWDHAPAAPEFYTFNQYTLYGLPGPGAGVTANKVKVSMDLFIDGSTTNNPLEVVYFQGSDHTFTPVLANGAYTSVSFTLDQTAGSAIDPTQSFNLQVRHGAGGFGFDAGNVVRIDNVKIEVVPEPATIGLASLAALTIVGIHRRRA